MLSVAALASRAHLVEQFLLVIAAGEQHGQSRPELPRRRDQGTTIHAGQADIGRFC